MGTENPRHARMIAMYQRGVEIAEIADQFGVLQPAVRKVLDKAGIERRTVLPLASWKDELAEHVANGGSIKNFSLSKGRTPNWAFAIWKMIRADLGAQAR